MNWFEDGTREFGRKTNRLVWRLIRLIEDRRLAVAERTLGELGWQQAEFSDAAQSAVESLNAAERQQAMLLNHSAEIAQQIGELHNELEANRRSLEEVLAPIEQERRPIFEAREELQRRLEAHEANLPLFKERLEKLELEARTLSRLNEDLMASNPTPADFFLQRGRLADYRAGVTNERGEIESNRVHAENAIRAMRQKIFAVDDQLSALARRAAGLQREFEAAETRILEQIRQREIEKAKTEKAIATIDHEKAMPFRLIGQCLADSDIPPINQPEALERVKRLRARVALLDQKIGDSVHRSHAREDASTFVLAGLTVVVIVLSGWFWLWLVER